MTAALGSSMRTPRVLAGLVDAVVPSLADFCAVHLVRDGGRGIEPIAVAAADPAPDRAGPRAGRSPGRGRRRAGRAGRRRPHGRRPRSTSRSRPRTSCARESRAGAGRAGGARHPLGRGPAAVGARCRARLADAGDGQLRPPLHPRARRVRRERRRRAPGSRSTTRGCSPSRRRSRAALQRTLLPAGAARDPGRPARRPLSRRRDAPTTSAATSTTSSTRAAASGRS